MARRRTSSSLPLPWENRGQWVRELFAGGRVRSLLVLGCLLGGGGVVWELESRRERVDDTRATIVEVRRAVIAFRRDFGRCPYNVRELVHPPRSGAHYLDSTPVDAWGRALWVRCPGRYDPEGVDIVSAGASGSFLDDDNVQ